MGAGRINYPFCVRSDEWTNQDGLYSVRQISPSLLPQPRKNNLNKMASVCCRIVVPRGYSLTSPVSLRAKLIAWDNQITNI